MMWWVLFWIVWALLWMGYIVLVGFYRRGWMRESPRRTAPADLPFLSVLVPARNEAARIPALLAALRAQTYPADRFEVLVLDDHSDDGTATVAATGGNVRVLAMAENVLGKKAALAYGIAEARGPWIVTTDADCVPGIGWLAQMADETEGNAFIAAPVRYHQPNDVCSVFQTLDFLMLQGITAASVATGMHSMCNGANLAYRKNAFEEVGGFAGIDHVASGDDLLLMHKIAVRYPRQVRYCKDAAAIVDTDAAPGWRAFWKQRVRWASKSAQYDDKRIFFALLLVYLFNVHFVVLGVMSFFNTHWLWLLLGGLLLKSIVELRLLASVARFFGQAHLLKWFPLLQPLHILYTVLVGALSQVGNYEWKGRRVK